MVKEEDARSHRESSHTDVSASPKARFEGFFAAQHPRLVRAMFLLTLDVAEAQDLAQEAMVRVFERWERVRRMRSPEGYLYRTALNLHRSRLRRLRRWAEVGRQAHRAEPDPLERAEQHLELDRLLAALPEGQRAALVLREWVGMSDGEVARCLGIGPSSVRSRISRARQALRAEEVSPRV